MRSFSLGLLLVVVPAVVDAAPRSPAEIQQVVSGHKAALRACYESALGKVPKLEGKFVYSLKIGANGKVTTAIAKAPTKATAALDQCITKELRLLAFPVGEEAEVNYPFVFSQMEGDPAPAGKALPPKPDTVAPELVKMFDTAASLAREGKHAEALAAYRAVLETQRKKKLAAIPRFIATVHLQASYALIDLGKLVEAETEIRLVEANTLDQEKLYEYHFTLGNILGGQGKLDPMFTELVLAISASEDLDDYTVRPAKCWTQALHFAMKAQDWVKLKKIGETALQASRVRGMKDVELQAKVSIAEASKHLTK